MAAKTSKLWKRASILILMFAMVSFSNIYTSHAEAAEIQEGYQLIGESDQYNLYMDEEYLSVIVEDKDTGATMESAIGYDDGKNNDTWVGSMKSAIVMTLIYQEVDTKQADLMNDKVDKTISYLENGFSAKLYWNEYQVGLTLEVTLEDDGLVAKVADDSIIEDGDKYNIGTIMIYPYMGNSYLDEKEGYLFIPDGDGALIYLNDKEGRFSSAYTTMIYGDDIGFKDSDVTALLWDRYEMINEEEDILTPIYGIAHTDDQMAYLAVVEEGAMRSKIEASPNGVSVDYNRVFARFIERRLYTQPTSNNTSTGSIKMVESDRSHSDLKIRFMFLSGEEADYTGMANAYREYLLRNDLLTQKDTSYNTRIDFLGTDREDWVFGTSAVVMTTIDDIREIYEDLASENVTDLFSVYKGWQKGGIYDLPITTYRADSKIGGTKALTELIQDYRELGINIYLYDNAQEINPSENNATFNVVKRVDKRKYDYETYKDVYSTFLFLIPARTNTLASKLLSSYTNQGVDTLAVAGISNRIFSWSYGGDFYTRYDCAEQYQNTIHMLDESAEVVLEKPYAYLWKYTDAFLDMPLSISDYIYEDESIPFMSIVLKGVVPMYSDYINFEANKQEYFLKLVETGTYPSFYITKESSSELIYTNSNDIYSSQYRVFKNMIIEYTGELKQLNETIGNATIEKHQLLENDVRKVTYSNGVVIYVNYSDSSQDVDGITIDAMNYKVVGE